MKILFMEQAAIKIMKQAIMDEENSNYQSALVLYKEAIDLLLTVFKKCENPEKKNHLKTKLEEYMTRAEAVKTSLAKVKKAGNFHEQIKIAENSTNHSYYSIFKPYLDDILSQIWIEDAYIRSHHQICNFLRFCEMLVSNCQCLKNINLTTTSDPQKSQNQDESLKKIAADLKKRGICLKITYSSDLHDREIRFNTGWIIKIGRGLDMYKRVEPFSLGYFEQNMKPCHATTVDIFHSNHTKKSL